MGGVVEKSPRLIAVSKESGCHSGRLQRTSQLEPEGELGDAITLSIAAAAGAHSRSSSPSASASDVAFQSKNRLQSAMFYVLLISPLLRNNHCLALGVCGVELVKANALPNPSII